MREGRYGLLFRLVDTRPAGEGFPDMLAASSLREDRLKDLGVVAPAPGELDELRGLRDALEFVVLGAAASLPARVTALNSLVGAYGLSPRLDAAVDVVWTSSRDGRIARLAEQVLPTAIDLVRSGDVARVQLCCADDCAAPFVPASTPNGRTYCSPRCSTRVRVRRHRAAAAQSRGLRSEPFPVVETRQMESTDERHDRRLRG